MFPWVCLATMPLFYPFDWPKTIIPFLKIHYLNIKKTICNIVNSFKCNIKCHCQNNDVRNEDIQMMEAKSNVQEELHTNMPPNDVKDITNENHNGTDGASNEEKANEQVNKEQKETRDTQEESIANIEIDKINHHKKLTTLMIIVYVLTQAFLPFSHFITKVRKAKLYASKSEI